MRLVRLGKIAAQAEILRVRRLARRQAFRAVYAAIAAIFALSLLAWLHVAAAAAIAARLGPVYAALIVAGADLVIAAILGFLAAHSGPDRIEREAATVRDEARAQMAEAAAMTMVVGPLVRRAGLGVVDRLFRPARR